MHGKCFFFPEHNLLCLPAYHRRGLLPLAFVCEEPIWFRGRIPARLKVVFDGSNRFPPMFSMWDLPGASVPLWLSAWEEWARLRRKQSQISPVFLQRKWKSGGGSFIYHFPWEFWPFRSSSLKGKLAKILTNRTLLIISRYSGSRRSGGGRRVTCHQQCVQYLYPITIRKWRIPDHPTRTK